MAPPHNFSLPVVFENLRDPESLHQLIDSLEALDRVTEEVFSGLTARCTESSAKLGSLRARLATAEARITSISGRSHAVKVFSPSKYPAPEKLEDYVAVNHGGSSLGKGRKLKRGNFSLPPISAEEEEKERCTQEESSLFETSANAAASSIGAGDAVEGLGSSIPARVNSVGSILLFNSTINPYKSYAAIDNLDVAPELREEERDELPTAPKSVATAESYEGMGRSDISYQPGAAPLSELNLAPTLDLPGAPIATGSAVTFTEETTQIAPSVLMLQNLDQLMLDLPDIGGAGPAGNAAAPSSATAPPPPPPTQSETVPPPPPPPPAPAPQPSSGKGKKGKKGSDAAPPPPPPVQDVPPPPPLPSGAETTPAPAPAPAPDGRGSLLDAIRNPKLGKNRLQEAAKKVIKAKKTAAVAGDFMSQMKAQMESRRSAMAGKPAASDNDDDDDDGMSDSDDDADSASGGPPPPPPPASNPLLSQLAGKRPSAGSGEDGSDESDWDESDD